MVDVFDRARTGRPGWARRPDSALPDSIFGQPAPHLRQSEPQRLLIARDATGDVRGYAFFVRKLDWPDTGPNGTTKVREFVALDPPTARALWGRLLRPRPAGQGRGPAAPHRRRAAAPARRHPHRRADPDGRALAARHRPARARSPHAATAPRSTSSSRSPTRCCPATPGRWRVTRRSRPSVLRAHRRRARPGARRPRARHRVPRAATSLTALHAAGLVDASTAPARSTPPPRRSSRRSPRSAAGASSLPRGRRPARA